VPREFLPQDQLSLSGEVSHMKIEFYEPMQFGHDPRRESDRNPIDNAGERELTALALEIAGVTPRDYCEFPAKENQELFKTIRPEGQYLEIAKAFREHADPAAVGFFNLGRYAHCVHSYFQMSQLEFEALAKKACFEMGYVGPRPVRFFLHKLATWKGELKKKRASNTWTPNADGSRKHGVNFEIPEIFTVAALFCENQAARAERQGETLSANNVTLTPAVTKTSRELTPAQKTYIALYEAIRAVGGVKSDGSIKLDATSLRRILVEMDKRNIELPDAEWCDHEDKQTWQNACFTSKAKVKSYLSNIPNRIKTLR